MMKAVKGIYLANILSKYFTFAGKSNILTHYEIIESKPDEKNNNPISHITFAFSYIWM